MYRRIAAGIVLVFMASAGLIFARNLNEITAVAPYAEIKYPDKTNKKMKIEIWSDVVCPFCYIGKTKFEIALRQFANKNDVEVEWKSYQLMPDLATQPDKNIDQVLAETKGVSLTQAQRMNEQAVLMGKQAGLEYNFSKAVVANTFRAHQFLHFTKANGKQSEAEGLLFRSYFTDGRNVDDISTLIELGKSIGLDALALQDALEHQTYAGDVRSDISEAGQLGVRGVPFFVFNRKYAVSGAQDAGVYLDVLERSFAEWHQDNTDNEIKVKAGAACKPGGNCD